MSQDQAVDQQATPMLSPPRRGANWRVTGLAAGILLILVLLKLVTSHPQPRPSHLSPSAAAVGYIDALRSGNLVSLQSYLAPSQRRYAVQELQALRADHVLLVSPVVESAIGEGGSMTVAITVEVCYRRQTNRSYTCQLIQHQPLGLPSALESVRIGGRWYISTLLDPQPLR